MTINDAYKLKPGDVVKKQFLSENLEVVTADNVVIDATVKVRRNNGELDDIHHRLLDLVQPNLPSSSVQQTYAQGQDPWTTLQPGTYKVGSAPTDINTDPPDSQSTAFEKHNDRFMRDVAGQWVNEPKTCLHKWQSYTGLNETFEFCVKCDEKRGER